MRVIFASTDYIEPGKSSTGLPVYLKRVSQALYKCGHEPIIVYAAMYNQHRFDDGVEVYSVRIPVESVAGIYNKTSARLRCLMTGYYVCNKIEGIETERKVDIIQFVSLSGIALFYTGRLPSVVRLSSYAKLAYDSSCGTVSQECIDVYSDLELEAGRYIGNVFGPSELTAREYEKDYGHKVRIIESPFTPIEELDYSVYNKYLSNRKYAIFFGKMYAEKGILELCDVLEPFLRMDNNYYFVFVGSDSSVKGRSAHSLIMQSAGEYVDRVVILSELCQAKLFAMVERAVFVVNPSYMENFSNACLEAMYYNGCVIAFCDSGFEQLIEHRVSGFLCKKRSVYDLLDTMNYVAGLCDDELASIRTNARKRIKENSPSRITDQLIRYYEEIIDKDKCLNGRKLHEYCKEVAPYMNGESICSVLTKDADKRYLNSRVVVAWIRKLLAGEDPISTFYLNGEYDGVAVYGLMELGTLLVDFLETKGISVKYTIDRNIGLRYKDYAIFHPSDCLPSVGLIIVTPIVYYEEIAEDLRIRTTAKIVSIEDLILT